MTNSILIIGPFPGPPKGVSLSNQVIYNGLLQQGLKVRKINTEHATNVDTEFGRFAWNKLAFLKTYLQFYKFFFSDVIYMTIGITFFGVLKYAPFVILARIMNKKSIVHVHSDHLKTQYKSLGGIRKNIFKRLLSTYDSGIVLSESLRDNLEPFLPPDQIFELYNFVEDSLILPKEVIQEKKDYSEIRLFFLSNLLEEKGINVLLQVLTKLQREGINLTLKIAGNKVAGNNVNSLIEGLPGAEYLGVVLGQKKQDLLLWGNVFCLPTFFVMEGQPISILEALSFDNLILTTRHAGIPDICSEENTIFCKEHNEEDLYLKLKYIIENWSEMQSKAIGNGIDARNRFTETKFLENLNKIIQKTLVQ